MVGQVWYGNTPTQPEWLKSFGGREHMALFPARIDPTQFSDDLATVITTTADVQPGTNEVQTVTISATGGTFTMTGNGKTTAALAYNISLAAFQTALDGLFGAGNTAATGNAGGPFSIVFQDDLAQSNIPALTTNAAALTGGGQTATVATVVNGAGGATSIPVTITGPIQLGRYVTPTANKIPANTAVSFGGDKFVLLTQDALLGDTTLNVSPIPFTIRSGAKGFYQGYNRKTILSGKLVGRSFADAAAGNPFKPAFVNGTLVAYDETFLTMFTIDDAMQNQDVELVQVGKHVTIALTYLPDYALYDSATITWLRANYNCIIPQGG